MKNLSYSANCIFTLFITVLFLIAVPPSFGITAGKELATVEDEVITMSDYQRFINGIGGIQNTDAVDKTLLERLIVDMIIRHAAVRRGIEVAELDTTAA